MKFKPKKLIIILLLIHIIPYVLWCFVVMSLKQPIIDTFINENSRLIYVFYLVCFIGLLVPIYLPFENDNANK